MPLYFWSPRPRPIFTASHWRWTAELSKGFSSNGTRKDPFYFFSSALRSIHRDCSNSQHSQKSAPSVGGYLDVGIVVLIFINGFTIHGMNKSRPAYYISYQAALYLFPIILTGLWIYRDMLDFNILLPGLAWRTFFFFGILPYGLNLWKQQESAQ